ncbi:hypothetical protein, partial [Cupriavidus sp. UYPR2.512]|uniref:hypothetical protein n=1 Tax=Cupriavidus sp. UYPR2.512 TaxID=1080187 RepID=UPI000475E535
SFLPAIMAGSDPSSSIYPTVRISGATSDHGADRAQRMRLRHEIFESQHGEQAFGEGVGAAHESRMEWYLVINALARYRADFGLGISAAC